MERFTKKHDKPIVAPEYYIKRKFHDYNQDWTSDDNNNEPSKAQNEPSQIGQSAQAKYCVGEENNSSTANGNVKSEDIQRAEDGCESRASEASSHTLGRSETRSPTPASSYSSHALGRSEMGLESEDERSEASSHTLGRSEAGDGEGVDASDGEETGGCEEGEEEERDADGSDDGDAFAASYREGNRKV